MTDPTPALIPTCANTYGERGHVWHELIGGRRCEVCGKQEAIPSFIPAPVRLAEFYAFRVARPRFIVNILETSSS